MFRYLKKGEPCSICKCKREKYKNDVKHVRLNFIRQKSYYQVLGLDSTASPKDIKEAYYKLCLQFHPDKNDGCLDSVAKFREITEAYEVLSNPEKKRYYDQRDAIRSSYTNSYRQNEYYHQPYNQRKHHQYPFTGKTKDFDYDEHYKQHYEKQRQADFEYFKHRWEADRRRRATENETYFRNWFKYSDRPHEENTSRMNDNKKPFEETQKEFSRRYYYQRQRPFMYLFPVWCLFFFMIPLCSEFLNPEKPLKRPPLYYEVKDEDETKCDE